MQSGQKVPEKGQGGQPPKLPKAMGAGGFLWRGLIFLLVGLVLYSGVYAWSENLVHSNTELNRFYKIKTAENSPYDWVFFGASHALVMDLQDMNAQLEEITGSKILNLGEMGGGPAVSGVLLDYFLAKHETRGAVYFVDSFVFYSDFWNEGRLADVGLYQRAPFDPALAKVLLQNSATRWKGLDYLFGFSKNNFWVTGKINSLREFNETTFRSSQEFKEATTKLDNKADWPRIFPGIAAWRDNSQAFKSDISGFPQAASFTKRWGGVPQLDRQRMDYLYGVVTGTHRGVADAVSLTDTTKDFSNPNLGVKVGGTLTNITDGSSTTITAITTTTEPNDTLVGVLSGGAENDWDEGDVYVYGNMEVDMVFYERYMTDFENQIERLKEKNARVVLIRSPLPNWVRNMTPSDAWKKILSNKENWFDEQIRGVAEKHGVELYDFSKSVPSQSQYWMDTDHLNQAGMLYFAQQAKAASGELFKDILKP